MRTKVSKGQLTSEKREEGKLPTLQILGPAAIHLAETNKIVHVCTTNKNDME